MATFDNHIAQAKRNLKFFIAVNSQIQDSWDWQVTVCFYTAVHLVNGHLAQVGDLHYRTHEAVKLAINPESQLTMGKVDLPTYLAYAKLEGLARRARYLCHDDFQNKDERAHFTYDKHLAKAVKNLDILLDFFKNKYKIDYGMLEINCMDLAKAPLKHFKIKRN